MTKQIFLDKEERDRQIKMRAECAKKVQRKF
jgi:hypothetical protein